MSRGTQIHCDSQFLGAPDRDVLLYLYPEPCQIGGGDGGGTE